MGEMTLTPYLTLISYIRVTRSHLKISFERGTGFSRAVLVRQLISS